MYGYGHDMGGWGWFGGSLMMVLFAFLIGLAVYVAIKLTQRPPQ